MDHQRGVCRIWHLTFTLVRTTDHKIRFQKDKIHFVKISIHDNDVPDEAYFLHLEKKVKSLTTFSLKKSIFKNREKVLTFMNAHCSKTQFMFQKFNFDENFAFFTR